MKAPVDQFFTTQASAWRCWYWLHQYSHVPEQAHYIEPSVGGGAFYNIIPDGRRTGFEIDGKLAQQLDGVLRADFLQLDPLTISMPAGPLVFVGNPPFGPRGVLAVEFINKAFELGADVVAFILPPAFRPRNGRAPRIEGRIKGGYSVAHFDNIEPHYDLPAGGEKHIPNCTFVVYRRGKRPSSAPGATCNSWAKVFCVNRKAGRGTDIDGAVYFPHMVRPGSRTTPLQAYHEIVTNEMIGVLPLREPDRVLGYLCSQGEALGRPSSNRNINVSCSSVREALIRGGFVD